MKDEIRQALIELLGGEAAKAAGSTPNTSYAHGPGGLFSHPALEQPLYSAIVTPHTGLQYILPVRGTLQTDPLFGILTGVTAASGSHPSTVCGDPKTAGLLKLCMGHAPLGRFSLQTSVVNIDRVGKITDRGEHTDFIVYGTPRAATAGSGIVPTMPGGFDLSAAANSETGKRMLEFMVEWARQFASVMYEGNPANNSGEGYKEFKGLDILINTGYSDAETDQACPAADSLVRNFGNLNVATNGDTLVQEIASVYTFLQQLANETGLAPLELVIAMPFGLFYELTSIWPCSYLTDRCTIGTGETNFVNGPDAIRMRDEMRGDLDSRRGQYLLINGLKVPVVIDDAITQDGLGAGVQSTTIYFIPLRVGNGRPVTYIEYFDYKSAGTLTAARQWAPADSFDVSDNGRFLWHRKPPTNWCIQALALTEWRVILRTPYLAARITNVAYTPRIPLRSGDPSSPYFVDGGRIDRQGYGPSYYA